MSSRNSAREAKSHAFDAGFSLIELMVALTVLLFSLGGVVSAYMAAARANAESFGHLQAMNTLRDVAGDREALNQPQRITPAAYTSCTAPSPALLLPSTSS